VRIRTKDYVKYLLKDVVIRCQEDIWLKVREDFSIKNMSHEEAAQTIRKNKDITPPKAEKLEQ